MSTKNMFGFSGVVLFFTGMAVLCMEKPWGYLVVLVGLGLIGVAAMKESRELDG